MFTLFHISWFARWENSECELTGTPIYAACQNTQLQSRVGQKWQQLTKNKKTKTKTAAGKQAKPPPAFNEIRCWQCWWHSTYTGQEPLPLQIIQVNIKGPQIQQIKWYFLNTFSVKLCYCHACDIGSAYKSLQTTEMCGRYIILSTFLLIAHQGKIMCCAFEIICERFLKCYHHMGNDWHCAEIYFSTGLFILETIVETIVSVFMKLTVSLYFTAELLSSFPTDAARTSTFTNMCVLW